MPEQYAKENHAFYRVETPSVFLEYELPVTGDLEGEDLEALRRTPGARREAQNHDQLQPVSHRLIRLFDPRQLRLAGVEASERRTSMPKFRVTLSRSCQYTETATAVVEASCSGEAKVKALEDVDVNQLSWKDANDYEDETEATASEEGSDDEELSPLWDEP